MPRFVAQEHWASTHHFDFRLEMDEVYKSWAVHKGLPMQPGIRRLAIKVDDHPLSYGSFEGTIPKGEYGAGDVKIWDSGGYDLDKHSPREICFTLHGLKLQGTYGLLFLKMEREWGQWLLFKLGADASK